MYEVKWGTQDIFGGNLMWKHYIEKKGKIPSKYFYDSQEELKLHSRMQIAMQKKLRKI